MREVRTPQNWLVLEVPDPDAERSILAEYGGRVPKMHRDMLWSMFVFIQASSPHSLCFLPHGFGPESRSNSGLKADLFWRRNLQGFNWTLSGPVAKRIKRRLQKAKQVPECRMRGSRLTGFPSCGSMVPEFQSSKV